MSLRHCLKLSTAFRKKTELRLSRLPVDQVPNVEHKQACSRACCRAVYTSLVLLAAAMGFDKVGTKEYYMKALRDVENSRWGGGRTRCGSPNHEGFGHVE